MKVFIDTNVLIDILAERQPFFDVEYEMFKAFVSHGDTEIAWSTLSVSTAFYICHDHGKMPYSEIWRKIDLISSGLTVTPLTNLTLLDARLLNWKDFEDSLQFCMAKDWGADLIVTRDVSGFAESTIKVCSPAEVLEIFSPY